jgi:hypothetical protein
MLNLPKTEKKKEKKKLKDHHVKENERMKCM